MDIVWTLFTVRSTHTHTCVGPLQFSDLFIATCDDFYYFVILNIDIVAIRMVAQTPSRLAFHLSVFIFIDKYGVDNVTGAQQQISNTHEKEQKGAKKIQTNEIDSSIDFLFRFHFRGKTNVPSNPTMTVLQFINVD